MKELLKKFARYEISAKELPNSFFEYEETDEEDESVHETIYQITLQDLLAVVKKLEEEKIAGSQFLDEWLWPTYEWKMDEALGFEQAMGISEENEMMAFPLPRNEAELFRLIYQKLDCPDLLDDERPAFEIIDTENVKELVLCYEQNKCRAMKDWEFPDNYKKSFIGLIDDMMQTGLKYGANEIELFVRYVNELAEKGDDDAKKILGYQCYGGSEAFACDWEKARDIFEELFEKTGRPGFANTLGYIYYYGRCNNGIPEYEKAFKYFSYGSAAGYYESSYKIADMIRQGKSVPKNPEVAENMVRQLYNENRRHFENGIYDCNFADLALRMGGFCEERCDEVAGTPAERIIAVEALEYYLHAELAIKMRMEEGDYYGDDVVAININKALNRIRSKIELKEGDYVVEDRPRLLTEAVGNGDYLLVTFAENKGGLKISFHKGIGRQMIVTAPEYGYCKLVDSFDVYTTVGANESTVEFGREYLITELEWDWGDYTYFYSGDELVLELNCQKWMYKLDRMEESERSEKLTIATVAFTESPKGYDYICDIPGVSAGDVVIVNAGGLEKEVTVLEMKTVQESDLAMPRDRYKEIIGKKEGE